MYYVEIYIYIYNVVHAFTAILYQGKRERLGRNPTSLQKFQTSDRMTENKIKITVYNT